MTAFISHIHKNLRDALRTRRGATHLAKDVPQGLHKEYARMSIIELQKPSAIELPLTEALVQRRSYIEGSLDKKISIQKFGTLLGAALGKNPDTVHRNYPSGGALYPIETYIITNAIEGLSQSVLHYNPTKHALEILWPTAKDLSIKSLAPNPKDLQFSTLIVFTSVWRRSSAKYGDFTYTLALLEAGHMSENILLVAGATGLKARPMAGFNDEAISILLDLDRNEEQLVLSVTLSG